MSTELRSVDGCVVVDVAADAQERELELVLRLAEREERPVIVDLTTSGVLPSPQVAVLLVALARVEAGNGSLVFLLPEDESAAVPHTFAIDGVEDVLPVTRTWDDALAHAAYL